MISRSNIALKEWAVTIKALDEGIQTILFRKGGIHEEGREFRIEHNRFLLYPTYEHQREELLKDKFRKELYTILHDLNDTKTLKIRNWATISHIAEITQWHKSTHYHHTIYGIMIICMKDSNGVLGNRFICYF